RIGNRVEMPAAAICGSPADHVRIRPHPTFRLDIERIELAFDSLVAGNIDEECAEHIAIGAIRTASDFFDSVPRIGPGDVGERVAFRIDSIDDPGRSVVVTFSRDHSYLPASTNDP